VIRAEPGSVSKTVSGLFAPTRARIPSPPFVVHSTTEYPARTPIPAVWARRGRLSPMRTQAVGNALVGLALTSSASPYQATGSRRRQRCRGSGAGGAPAGPRWRRPAPEHGAKLGPARSARRFSRSEGVAAMEHRPAIATSSFTALAPRRRCLNAGAQTAPPTARSSPHPRPRRRTSSPTTTVGVSVRSFGDDRDRRALADRGLPCLHPLDGPLGAA
jgi:hypothetical protein